MTASRRRTRTPWRTPWRTLALIAVGALLLGAGIGGAILRARHLRGAALRGLEEALAANARQAAAGVGFWIGERRADAAVTGRHLLQFADQAGGLASPAAGLRMGKTLDVVRQHYGYRAAWVLDTAGTVVARSGPAGATLDPAERSAARASAMDGAPAVVGPFRGADGRPVLALVAALAGSEGKSLGAVAIEIDLEATLLPRIPVRLAGSETGQSRLVGRIGDEFVVISGSLKPPAAPFSRRLPWAQARTVAQLVTSGRDTAGVFVDFEHRSPIGFAETRLRRAGRCVEPDVPEQVDHDRRPVCARVAERQVGQDAHLLLELRGDAGVDRIVPAVVRTRSDLVDQQAGARG